MCLKSFLSFSRKSSVIKKYIPTNSIENNSDEYFYMASVCRQYTIDKQLITFLESNKQSNVVFLGAGLETAYDRIKDSNAHFYQNRFSAFEQKKTI